MHRALVLLLAAACAPTGAATSSPDAEAGSGVPSDALPATNREAGQSLDLTIPVLDGRPASLESVRGRVVILEITATWIEGFGANDEAYLDLLETRAGEAHVIIVGMDPERSSLDARWSTVAPAGLWRAWDPQGAVAAQLQAAKLPTLIVLDQAGVILRVWGGYRLDQWDEVVDTVNAALP